MEGEGRGWEGEKERRRRDGEMETEVRKVVVGEGPHMPPKCQKCLPEPSLSPVLRLLHRLTVTACLPLSNQVIITSISTSSSSQ